jgi:hypothetical protein
MFYFRSWECRATIHLVLLSVLNPISKRTAPMYSLLRSIYICVCYSAFMKKDAVLCMFGSIQLSKLFQCVLYREKQLCLEWESKYQVATNDGHVRPAKIFMGGHVLKQDPITQNWVSWKLWFVEGSSVKSNVLFCGDEVRILIFFVG